MAGPCEASVQAEAGRSSTSMKNTIHLGNTELVVKFKHHYPPHLFGVRKDGNFDSFMSSVSVPVFFPKVPDKKAFKRFRSIITNRDLYNSEKKKFDKQHGRFSEDILEEIKNRSDRYVSLAKFVTECYLYDYEEWKKGAPKIEVNPDTGERVTLVKPLTPDSQAVGRAFCSAKEQNYSKETGRTLALERAKEQYRKKFL